ncbi:MAG: Xanthine phosphoribosyltransferase [Oscillospiraceae bacterium]|nr:Xanthine phosphoribosyltransferase [Oscillospiraceae bacterium]
MDDLKRMLLNDAELGEGDIIRVDMFLNHCVDVELLENIGKELAKRFRNDKITKVLTAESSGIPLACFVARALKVPFLFAKKFQTGYIDPDVYSTEVHSFALEKTYTLRISKRYLLEDDCVLLVDDMLASGQALLGLMEICAKAGAEVSGVGVAIEKATRDGGRVLRSMGIRVEALATVERVENGAIILADD